VTLRGQGRRASSLGSADPRTRRAADALAGFEPVPPLALDERGKLALLFERAGYAWRLAWNGREVVASPPFSPTPVKTSAYTAKVEELVLCDPTGGGFTVTLPDAAKCKGQPVTVKNASSSTNTITIAGAGMDEVDGASSVTITTARGVVTVVSDGSAWHTV
jgi:hypothetical protein